MSQDNQDFTLANLLYYANNLEQIVCNYAKYDVLRRKNYERKIQNLAQLSIDKGLDIDDIVKEINQEKKNEKIKEKVRMPNKNENNIKEIEIENISSQIFCEDFHNNLYQYLKRKKESLKISNLFNNNNSKNNYNTNNNKYKIEQNNSYDSKKNTVYIPVESSKTNVKTLGKKRKSK